MHRVFIAILISKSMQKEILQWQQSHNSLDVRWLSGKNLHITLVPPWEEENPEEAVTKLKEAKRTGLFDLNFTEVEFGPNPRFPRLIWAKASTPENLTRLKQSVENTLKAKVGRKEFLTHMTLARFRPENFSEFADKNLKEAVDWKMRVSSFALLESHLSGSGAEYKTLATFKLDSN